MFLLWLLQQTRCDGLSVWRKICIDSAQSGWLPDTAVNHLTGYRLKHYGPLPGKRYQHLGKRRSVEAWRDFCRFLTSSFQTLTQPKSKLFYMSRNISKRTFWYVPNEYSNQPARPFSLNSFRCSHEETQHPWLFNMRLVNIQVRLQEYVSSLGAQIQRYVFSRWGSFIKWI